MNLKNFHSILCIKNWKIFIKCTDLKSVTPETVASKNIKQKVLDNVIDQVWLYKSETY